jgi:hypothetical protein
MSYYVAFCRIAELEFAPSPFHWGQAVDLQCGMKGGIQVGEIGWG